MGHAARIQPLGDLPELAWLTLKREMMEGAHGLGHRRGVGLAVLVGEDGDQPPVARIEIEMALVGVVEIGLIEDEGHAEHALPEVDRGLAIGAVERDVMHALHLDLRRGRRLRVIHRRRGGVAVVFIDGLLAHRERAGEGDLDLPVGMGAKEFQVPHLHRARAADRADYARHRYGLARARHDLAVVVEVEPVQRRGEAVGVALAPDLAIGQDVEPRLLLLANGDTGGVVLRLLQDSGSGMRQSSLARVRGGNCPFSFSRSMSQSGWQ
jgi:hypothetical protein